MEFQAGDVVLGEVTGLKPYGAFVRLPTGEVGLVHISEVAPEYVRDITQYVAIGQEICVKLLGQNEEGKWNLSLKRVTKQEEEAAWFRREMEAFRQALTAKEREGPVPEAVQLPIHAHRPSSPHPQAPLRAWLRKAQQELERLKRNQQHRQRTLERA